MARTVAANPRIEGYFIFLSQDDKSIVVRREFQISARRPTILTEVFRGFPQTLQPNARIVT
jgi:hypothetical protein